MAKKKEKIKKAKSKDVLQGFSWNKDVATIYPNFSFKAVINMMNNDPVARGAMSHFVDKFMEGDWAIVKKEDKTYDKEFENKLLYDFNFNSEVLRKLAIMGKLFNNAFLEIVRFTDNSVKFLNVLDSENIEPITEPNGDVIGFKSKIPNPKTGEYPKWSSDEIVWFKFNDMSKGYAPVDTRALWENLVLKDYIKRYITWLWKTGQYRVLYNFKGASDTNINDFLTYARKHDDNFKAPFLLRGDMNVTMIRSIQENENIIRLLSYLDNQSLILLRVPPIDAGIPDSSGRSNSDAQSNNFTTHISSYKSVVADTINKYLFPKMNKGNDIIVFSPIDRFSEKMVLDNVNIMKNMGMKEEIIIEYLNDKGMFFSGKQLFQEVKQSEQNNGLKKDINTMPSRFKGTGAPLEKVGTGEQSSTREDQLIKKASKFDMYPYTYEITKE